MVLEAAERIGLLTARAMGVFDQSAHFGRS